MGRGALSLETSAFFRYARFDSHDVEAWHELLLQLGARLPADLSAVTSTRGLPRVPSIQLPSGVELTGGLSLFGPRELFSSTQFSAQTVCIGTLRTLSDSSDDDGEGGPDPDDLLVDGSGRLGRGSRWAATLAEHLEAMDRALEALGDAELDVGDDDDEEVTASPPSVEEDVARQRSSGRPWWSHDWRRVFRACDSRIAHEILRDVGNAHTTSRGGGSVVGIDDLVHRLPEAARRVWVVDELQLARPPSATLAVSLDELSEAQDGRVLPREKLERLVPLAWVDRSPRVGAEAQWARALLLALGRPVAEHLVHAVRLVSGSRETLDQWNRALSLARRTGAL